MKHSSSLHCGTNFWKVVGVNNTHGGNTGDVQPSVLRIKAGSYQYGRSALEQELVRSGCYGCICKPGERMKWGNGHQKKRCSYSKDTDDCHRYTPQSTKLLFHELESLDLCGSVGLHRGWTTEVWSCPFSNRIKH